MEKEINTVGVIGGGSWGTAIARLLANKGISTTLYVLEPERAVAIAEQRENPEYLPGISLPKELHIVSDLEEAVKGKEAVVLGVPTSAVRSVCGNIVPFLSQEAIIVNLSKGIEQDSLKRVSEIVEEIIPGQPFVALSGPSHAEEVGRDMPTTVTAASKEISYGRRVQRLFSTENFRVYTQGDLAGVEIGGALKNIIALAAGITDGLGYGDNTKAALMTRGMYEMAKLGIALGGQPQTFHGLSGMGDLIVTCTSMHSRNRRCGILIGEGLSPEEAVEKVGMVVEGFKTAKSAYFLGKERNVEMPITQSLYDVLYNGADPRECIHRLMQRENKEEIEEIFY